MKTTVDHFAIIVELMSRDFLSTADHARIGRLARIVARQNGCCVDAVLEAAR